MIKSAWKETKTAWGLQTHNQNCMEDFKYMIKSVWKETLNT